MTTKKKAKVLSMSDEEKCRRAYGIPATPQLNEEELVEWLVKIATDSHGKYACSWIGAELVRRFAAKRKQLSRQQKSYDELWNTHYKDLERLEGELREVRHIATQEVDTHAHSIAELKMRIEAMQQEVLDVQRTEQLRTEADQRAIRMWQEANPGNDHVWPDAAKLTVWLMERWCALEQDAARAKSELLQD